MYFWVGYVQLRQNDLVAAEANFRDYLGVAERLIEIDSEKPEWRLELAYAHSNIGTVLDARGESAAALHEFRTTAAIHWLMRRSHHFISRGDSLTT